MTIASRGVLHHHALGDLELQAARLQAGARRSAPRHAFDEVALLELHAGDVDRHRQVGGCRAAAMRAPARHASRSTQLPSGTMSPVSSASGMNSDGRHEAALRMAPAHQRLHAGDARRCACRPSAGSAARTGRFSSAARSSFSSARRSREIRAHLGREEGVAGAARLLHVVHRRVGIGDAGGPGIGAVRRERC